MNDAIGKIRELLDELEARGAPAEPSFKDSFQLFELPELVANIIDYLQPALAPREAAIYWYLFRHSIVSTGDVFARLSTTELQEKVMASAGPAGTPSLSTLAVGEALIGLVTKEVISIAGEADGRGTPYRIRLPEEIAVCREAMARHRQRFPDPELQHELDFYRIKEYRLRVFERDGYACHVCKKQLTRFSATLDHRRPLSLGGDNGFANLVTSCWQHNSHRRLQPALPPLSSEPAFAPVAEKVSHSEGPASPAESEVGVFSDKTATAAPAATAQAAERTSAKASAPELPKRRRRKRASVRKMVAMPAPRSGPPAASLSAPAVPPLELLKSPPAPPKRASVSRRA